jgi:poly-gamma-glutamate synthesis protein (capsule biosynthesis protein)
VIEPIDWVDETLVYYSLGNFVNWTSGKGDGIANRMVGGMAMVTLSRGEDGEVFIKEAGVEPIVAHLEQGFAGVTVYALDEYTEELAQKNEIIKQDPAFSYAYCMSLADRVFGDWILEDEK